MDKQARESGIELLKIVAIFLIIISHVLQTMSTTLDFLPLGQAYVIDLSLATRNASQLVCAILRHSGALGNTIFFVCSAWYLQEKLRKDAGKWFYMLTEVWVISVLILALVACAFFGGGRYIHIAGRYVLKSLFPNIFANNWYITCYLLFYLIYPALNRIIDSMDQLHLLRTSFSLLLLYFGFGTIKSDFFFASPIITWIAIYFIVAYMKQYMKELAANIKWNIIFLLIGLIGHIGIIVATNWLDLKWPFLQIDLTRWNVNSNIFLLVTSLAMFNLARNKHFVSSIVNRVSGYSLLIYLIHENIILRYYVRPYIINFVYEIYGHRYMVLWVLVISAFIFIVSLMAAIMYSFTLDVAVRRLSEILYRKCKLMQNIFERILIKLLK